MSFKSKGPWAQGCAPNPGKVRMFLLLNNYCQFSVKTPFLLESFSSSPHQAVTWRCFKEYQRCNLCPRCIFLAVTCGVPGRSQSSLGRAAYIWWSGWFSNDACYPRILFLQTYLSTNAFWICAYQSTGKALPWTRNVLAKALLCPLRFGSEKILLHQSLVANLFQDLLHSRTIEASSFNWIHKAVVGSKYLHPDRCQPSLRGLNPW